MAKKQEFIKKIIIKNSNDKLRILKKAASPHLKLTDSNQTHTSLIWIQE